MDKLVQYIKRKYLQLKYYRYGWQGDYPSWSAARAACAGYNAANILEKVKAATLQVKTGQAVYERDSMLFDHIEYSWPLLANLLWLAGKNNNHLSLIDFGGSLGSSYFQNRAYLSQLSKLQWNVVEQAHFVQAGKKEIAGGPLYFFENIDEVMAANGRQDVLLLSCVLPYLEDPYAFLAAIVHKEIPYIIVDSTYFNTQPADRLTIQKVPPVYYDASYPAWFLDYDKVIKTLEPVYEMITAYNNEQILYLEGRLLQYKGFVMQLKKDNQ